MTDALETLMRFGDGVFVSANRIIQMHTHTHTQVSPGMFFSEKCKSILVSVPGKTRISLQAWSELL